MSCGVCTVAVDSSTAHPPINRTIEWRLWGLRIVFHCACRSSYMHETCNRHSGALAHPPAATQAVTYAVVASFPSQCRQLVSKKELPSLGFWIPSCSQVYSQLVSFFTSIFFWFVFLLEFDNSLSSWSVKSERMKLQPPILHNSGESFSQ